MIQNLILATLMSGAIGLGNIQPRVNENWDVNTVVLSSDATRETTQTFLDALNDLIANTDQSNNILFKIQESTYEPTYYNTWYIDDRTETDLAAYIPNDLEEYYEIVIDTTQTTNYLQLLDYDGEDTLNITNFKVYFKNQKFYEIYSQLTVQASGDMEIVETISSGLGLIGDLAQEFLLGFAHLFWDATANEGAGALTTFGIFALVMLGVAVSFAIVKLVLNIVRSNTGA